MKKYTPTQVYGIIGTVLMACSGVIIGFVAGKSVILSFVLGILGFVLGNYLTKFFLKHTGRK